MHDFRRGYPHHRLGGRRPAGEIDREVKLLRVYLQRPRTLAAIATKYSWSERTVMRRLHKVGQVWRVSQLAGGQRTLSRYVACIGW